MSNGWKLEHLPEIFNEVRSGSYSRAIETADGGVIAKLILRVFQDTRINIPDCGTTQGESVYADKTTLNDFLFSYAIDINGDTILIEEERFGEFMNKNIMVRTPGYCKAPEGFCAKCFGKLVEELGQEAFAPMANEFGRVQTTAALKKMHGTSHNTVDVSDINKYLIK